MIQCKIGKQTLQNKSFISTEKKTNQSTVKGNDVQQQEMSTSNIKTIFTSSHDLISRSDK